MKLKYLSGLFLTVLVLSLLACGQRPSPDSSADSKLAVSKDYGDLGEGAILQFDTLQHAFGDLQSGEEVACRFSFTNSGTAPLLIKDVKAGCGCTNVVFPKQPVNPGEKGSVEVTFNSRGRKGIQHQNVVVLSNGQEPSILLSITAQVK